MTECRVSEKECRVISENNECGSRARRNQDAKFGDAEILVSHLGALDRFGFRYGFRILLKWFLLNI